MLLVFSRNWIPHSGSHMNSLRALLTSLRIRRDLLFLYLLGAIFFLLQIWFLHQAAAPISDEGSHAEVGRMLFDGYLPYRDFYYPHPLLFPLFIGAGLRLFGSMYVLRVVYLILNILSIFPLYSLLKKWGGGSTAAMIAVIFYLTYNKMVNEDFRFLTSREFANLFLISFAYISWMWPRWKYRFVAQSLLAICLALTLYPAAANLAFISLADICRTKKWKEKINIALYYCGIAGIALSVLLVFFWLVPQSLEKTLLEHLRLPAMGRMARIQWILSDSKADLFFYGLSILSLLAGILFSKQLRAISFCMLGMIAFVFLPSEFWPHYMVSASIGLAVGICIFISLLLTFLKGKNLHFAYAIVGGATAVQLMLAFPPLLQEWMGNRDLAYHHSVQILARLPEPVLTFMEPIFAIDAKKKLVHYYWQSYRFTTTLHYNLPAEKFERLDAQACTIFLTGWDSGLVPSSVLSDWHRRFQIVSDPSGNTIFLTNRADCSSPTI